MLGRTDIEFDNICVWDLLDSKFPDFQVPRFPGPQPPPDELSDPNLTPLPSHPGVKFIKAHPRPKPGLARQISGDLEIWGPGNPGIWNPKICLKKYRNQNPFCPKCRQGPD